MSRPHELSVRRSLSGIQGRSPRVGQDVAVVSVLSLANLHATLGATPIASPKASGMASVLEGVRAAAPSPPDPANARATTSCGWIMPGSCCERSMYGRHALRKHLTVAHHVGVLRRVDVDGPSGTRVREAARPTRDGTAAERRTTFMVLNQSDGRGGRHFAASAIFWMADPASTTDGTPTRRRRPPCWSTTSGPASTVPLMRPVARRSPRRRSRHPGDGSSPGASSGRRSCSGAVRRTTSRT